MAAKVQQDQRKQRGPGKRFAKGVSANPAGRQKGSRNRVTALAKKLMEAGAEEITNAVLDAARSGDMTAARIVLDRIAPIRKGRPINFTLPMIKTAADVTKAVGSVLNCVAAGSLTVDEGAGVVSIIEAARRSIEIAELERRVAALEGKG